MIAAQTISNAIDFVKKLTVHVFCLVCGIACLCTDASSVLTWSQRYGKVELVTRTCCFIVDNICEFVEYLAAMIPMMCEFEPFLLNAAYEQMLSASIPNEMARSMRA